MIDSWSFSKISDFEKCKFYAYLKHDQRIPEPERPLRPGQTEHANDRGSRIHDACEMFVRGKGEMVHEMRYFETELNQMRNLFKQGRVSLEEEWGFDNQWGVMPWSGEWRPYVLDEGENIKDLRFTKAAALPKRGVAGGELIFVDSTLYIWTPCWHRSKLDAKVNLNKSGTEAVIIDYKTGRKFGNEFKHNQQLQLYTVDALMRYPHLEHVTTELWYLDQDDIMSMSFTRMQGLRFQKNFMNRGTAITTATAFPPNPNIHSCKWCQYGPWNGGQCEVGVQQQLNH